MTLGDRVLVGGKLGVLVRDLGGQWLVSVGGAERVCSAAELVRVPRVGERVRFDVNRRGVVKLALGALVLVHGDDGVDVFTSAERVK